MSEPQRIEGDRVYCHVCDHEWDRAHGGLQCPACESEFVEIMDSNSRSRPGSPPEVLPNPRSHPNSPPPIPPHPGSTRSAQSPLSPSTFQNHNPWAPDPDEDDITTYQFNTPGGRGTFSFSSRTYTFGGGNMRTSTTTSRDIAADEIGRSFESMLGNIMGGPQRRQPAMGGRLFEFTTTSNNRGFGQAQGQPPDLFSMLFSGGMGQPRNPNQPPSPFDLIGAMLNPANARRGDTVFSQEAFDRVMTQLMEQNQTNAPGPATENAISSLRKKAVDESMLGSDGQAECSICMDNLELGSEVTVLPCNHWFHGDCVISWLREHDTCPHCRQPISNSEDTTRPSPSRRRRSSRRSSSVASPIPQNPEGNNRDASFPDTPSGLRDARQRYYSGRTPSDLAHDRPSHERRSSERSQRTNDNTGGGGGGVAGWIRNRLPFSGQQ